MREMIKNYIEKRDWKVRENSNMGYSLQGLNNYIHQEIIKDFWLHEIYDKFNPKISEYHTNGFMHIHDLGSLSVYCVGWDLEELLRRGFNGVPGKVASGPAKHFRTALGQIVNFLYTMQGEAAGAVAFSNFDTLLAPFIRYDNLSYSEVKQCIQEFVFNMNVPTRVGFQSPFSNITMDLVVPSIYKDKRVIIGGVERKETYAEFQKEMNILNKAFAEVMIEGDYNGRPFSFPIPTYNITKDFNWDSEITTLIMRMTAKFGTPYFCLDQNTFSDKIAVYSEIENNVRNHHKRIEYVSIESITKDCKERVLYDITIDSDAHLFVLENGIISHNSNYINSDMKPEDTRSMCCRLRLDNKRVLEHTMNFYISHRKRAKRIGGLFASVPKTGSIGVVTINMPRLMYLSNGDEDKFYTLLDDVMEIAKENKKIVS